MKTSIQTAPNYTWGNKCQGWHLVNTPSLGIIQETMPPNTAEAQHRHHKAQQFFYILSGIATFEIQNQQPILLNSNEGIHVKAGQVHCIKNNGNTPLHFLVISEPHSHGDRENMK